MRTLIKTYILLISLLVISACATGNIQVPEKYALDNQLEPVKSIFKYGITDWEEIDDQSLILQKGPGDYYLIVLKIPAPELPFLTRIKLSSTGDMVRAGLDDVILYTRSQIRQSYPIERIYRFKDTAQMREVRDRLAGKTDAGKKDAQTVSPERQGLTMDKVVEI